MKRLNNKGVTTIEVIVCFVIVSIIMVSMYSTISYYNEKRILEGYKEKVINYKYQITREIQKDLVGIGLADAKITPDVELSTSKAIYTVDMSLRDSSRRRLIVEQVLAHSKFHPEGVTGVNDSFRIVYGDPSNAEDMIEYEFPKLGSYQETNGDIIQNLSINNILMEIIDNRVLSIYIGFYHPELGTRYAISIVTPIDFVFSS